MTIKSKINNGKYNVKHHLFDEDIKDDIFEIELANHKSYIPDRLSMLYHKHNGTPNKAISISSDDCLNSIIDIMFDTINDYIYLLKQLANLRDRINKANRIESILMLLLKANLLDTETYNQFYLKQANVDSMLDELSYIKDGI